MLCFFRQGTCSASRPHLLPILLMWHNFAFCNMQSYCVPAVIQSKGVLLAEYTRASYFKGWGKYSVATTCLGAVRLMLRHPSLRYGLPLSGSLCGLPCPCWGSLWVKPEAKYLSEFGEDSVSNMPCPFMGEPWSSCERSAFLAKRVLWLRSMMDCRMSQNSIPCYGGCSPVMEQRVTGVGDSSGAIH